MKRLLILPLVFAILFAACGGDPPAPSVPEPVSQASVPPPSQAPEPVQPDLPVVDSILPSFGGQIAEKKALNGDAIGWLQIPGTSVDGVVVQNPDTGDNYGNNYYLTHNFEKQPDSNGTYCADYRIDFGSGLPQNTILYGHNLSDDPGGELFAQLLRFKDPDFAREHPYIFFSTAEKSMVWEVYAVLDINMNVPYNFPEIRGRTFEQVMEVIYGASLYDYGVEVSEGDHLLTLTTCTYNVTGVGRLPLNVPNDYRFVVMARLVEPQSPLKETAAFKINGNVTSPANMPFICHETMDVVFLGGKRYFPSYDDSLVKSADTSLLEQIGEIRRTGVLENHGDWDAVLLPAGTQVYRHPAHEGALFVEENGAYRSYETFG